jgi:tetratricopeptide (TPR) repeat protein
MSARLIHRLVKAEQWPQAWMHVNEALNDKPEDPELLYLAGSILRAQGSIGMSLPLFAKALSKDQKQPNLWMHYGATLHDLNHWDDAIKAFELVARMLPTDGMPPANIAASLVQQGRWTEALKQTEAALRLDPENYIAHISAYFALLAVGRWREAYEHVHFLYGRHLVVRVYNSAENEEPEWDGSKGKTVVVQCDQGLGDILTYAGCLKEMQADCKEVILECAERLVPLMRRNFPGVTVYGTLKQAGQAWSLDHQIDAHIHISAVPKFYRRLDCDFHRQAYIRPLPELVEKWREWLSVLPKPWIGVSWQGGIQRTQSHLRSMALEEMAPVLELPGSFIDLSYRDNSAEIARWNIRRGNQVISPPIDTSDYDDTLALLWCLDEIVSVTTTVVDACGAMGKHVRVLVPDVPQWRYAYTDAEGGMLWYTPTVKLYRKKRNDRWFNSVKKIANDIKATTVVLE